MHHYLLSFHGMDVGLVYNLPKNVRIFMYCYPGKSMDASDCNEALTWFVATQNKYDNKGAYMEKLKLTINSKKYEQYCVFDGAKRKHNINRVPDLFFEDECHDFRTGCFHLPARFKRVFVRDNEQYKPGQQIDIDNRKFHKALEPFTLKNAVLPKKGFIKYFLEPSSIGNKKFKSIDFVVVPKPRTYHSYTELCKKTRKYVLESIPNTKNSNEQNTVRKIVKSTTGIYLSAIIQFLCKKHPGHQISIIVSACRVFHPDLPTKVKTNQSKTSKMRVKKYLKLAR